MAATIPLQRAHQSPLTLKEASAIVSFLHARPLLYIAENYADENPSNLTRMQAYYAGILGIGMAVLDRRIAELPGEMHDAAYLVYGRTAKVLGKTRRWRGGRMNVTTG